MLWYKSWLETRWRFLIGLFIVVCASAGVVLTWPRVADLIPTVTASDPRIREAIDVQRTWPGFIWSQAFAQNLTNMTTLFAVLLGTGGLLSPSSKSVLFTLALPASRSRISLTRAATGLIELFILAFAGSLAVSAFAPLIGQTWPPVDALAHGACLFAACTVFFALASLFSTMFTDIWRPLVIAIVIAFILGGLELATHGFGGFGLFFLMSGEALFRNSQFPWLAMLVSLTVSGALLWTAARTTKQHDF
jgi:hypothetical protein